MERPRRDLAQGQPRRNARSVCRAARRAVDDTVHIENGHPEFRTDGRPAIAATAARIVRRRSQSGGEILDLLLECFALLAGFPEVVLRLLSHPALWCGVECDCQANRHLRTDTRTTIQNLREGLPTHPQRLG